MNLFVLVIGGAGYIGSHLCKALALNGYTPVTYDSLKTGHRDFVRWGPFVQGDLLDTPQLIKTLQKYNPLAVFHLASETNARELKNQALSYYENNVGGTFSLLKALSCHPVPFLLFSSSAAVYGQTEDSLIKENSPLSPNSFYGRTKLSCEFAIADFCAAKQIQYALLRYFNAAGADPEGEIGEKHFPETHLIPLLIQVLQKKQPFFSLLGKPHPTKDKTAIRDFIHVTDLAEGHVQALDWLRSEKKDLIMNLGSGVGHTLLEVVSALEKQTGSNIPIQKLSLIEEPSSLVADITLAKKTIRFSPKHSSLETILNTALHWHR